nr:MAG TPA: hypothetical protein [Caudoviricetes sp.]DAL04575.1 MAG TPA: hypothetical protein [Caudoviricetes sp.]DAS78956.1 MAG TPA: hypothetical protein [Caudoviricetes sp.]
MIHTMNFKFIKYNKNSRLLLYLSMTDYPD